MKILIPTFLIGFAVGSITYGFDDFSQTFLGMNVYLLISLGAAIGAFVLSLFRQSSPARKAIVLWAGAEAAVLLRAFYDVTFIDPTSHNLLGLELILTSACILPSAFAGAFLTKLFK